MRYFDFLERVIDDGIRAARKVEEDYSRRPDQQAKLEGAVAGFEACRGRSPLELCRLLGDMGAAQTAAMCAKADGEITVDDYWRIRCLHAEVEWVANVVSAALESNGGVRIVAPTGRGWLKAAEILGVSAAGEKR